MAVLASRLAELGLSLPEMMTPAANYIPYVISGGHVHVAGQIPFLNGKPAYQGRVGIDLTVEQAVEASRLCALNILAHVNAAVEGRWDNVVRCVRLGGFVCCGPEFIAHSQVINGASDLIVAVMGEAGRHARFAVGVSSLPLGVPVEVDALFALK